MILVISGWWKGDNERLCALKPCLGLKIFLPPAGFKLGTAGSASQLLTWGLLFKTNNVVS